jgi:hypothetical protein
VAASSGATELTLRSTTGLVPSGKITAFPAATTEAAMAALRISYTGITGNTLTGVTGVTEALLAEMGVAQHFLTGVSGGSGTAIADNTSVRQLGRAVQSVSGTWDFKTSMNGSPAPLLTFITGMRITGEIIEKPNPFKGVVEITVGKTEGSVAHNLQGTPGEGFYSCSPIGDPQQRFWVTVSSSNITVHVAAAIATTAVKFNVEAQMTWA